MINKPLGDPLVVYKSFNEQLEHDEDMKKLAMMYGVSNPEQKAFIESKVHDLFIDYGEQYVKVAIAFLNYVGGLMKLLHDVKGEKLGQG